MVFVRKIYSFNAFDGKGLIVSSFDLPSDGEGTAHSYLDRYAAKCYDFVSTKLFYAVKAQYQSDYTNRVRFDRYYYSLDITETYAKDETRSYLLTVTLKRRGEVLAQLVDSCTFFGDLLIKPRILIANGKRKGEKVLLNGEGIVSLARFSDGRIEIIPVCKKHFDIKKIKP